jgi:hypothetical protein
MKNRNRPSLDQGLVLKQAFRDLISAESRANFFAQREPASVAGGMAW